MWEVSVGSKGLQEKTNKKANLASCLCLKWLLHFTEVEATCFTCILYWLKTIVKALGRSGPEKRKHKSGLLIRFSATFTAHLSENTGTVFIRYKMVSDISDIRYIVRVKERERATITISRKQARTSDFMTATDACFNNFSEYPARNWWCHTISDKHVNRKWVERFWTWRSGCIVLAGLLSVKYI